MLYLRFRDDLLTVLVDLSFSPTYREAMNSLASTYLLLDLMFTLLWGSLFWISLCTSQSQTVVAGLDTVCM